MSADRLAAIARRITRDVTFERVVSPAVADLQHGSGARRTVRLKGYAGS